MRWLFDKPKLSSDTRTGIGEGVGVMFTGKYKKHTVKGII
jgi:hypothetical protein